MGVTQSFPDGPDASASRIPNTDKCSHTPIVTTTVTSFIEGTYLTEPAVEEALAQYRMFAKYRSILKFLPTYTSETFGDQVKEHDVVIRHPSGFSIVALKAGNDATHKLLINLQ